MSEEAKGRNGQVIGTPEYWKQVCGGTILHDSIDFSGWTSSMFQAALRAIGTRASKEIDQIYQDLSDCGSRIRYIPSDDRAALAKQVSELYNVCQMADVTSWHSGDCERALGLSALSPWSNPLRNDRAIESAMEIVKRQSRLSSSEVLSLLKEAAKHSVSFAAGNDEYKTALLESVAPGNDEALLRDIADEFENETGTPDYKGRCGYSIGSRAYLSHVEAEVFECGVPILYSAAFGDPNYVDIIKETLQAAANQLEQDLDDAIREDAYITDTNANRLRGVVDDLEACGVRAGFLADKINALPHVNEKVRRLQEALNALGRNVNTDGVFGKETEKAALDFANELSKNLEMHLNNTFFFQKINDILTIVDELYDSDPVFAGLLAIPNAILESEKAILRVAWEQSAIPYLHSINCPLAAELLEHSLQDAPCDLHFSNSSWEAQKVLKSVGVQNIIAKVCKKMEENLFLDDYNCSYSVNFGDEKIYDQDLHYAIGRVTINCTCQKRASDTLFTFTLGDRYDYEELRFFKITESGNLGFRLDKGSTANNFGLVSQSIKAITPYYFSMTFQTTIPLTERGRTK